MVLKEEKKPVVRYTERGGSVYGHVCANRIKTEFSLQSVVSLINLELI